MKPKYINLLTQTEYIESTPVSSCCSTRIDQTESTIEYITTGILSHPLVMRGLEPKTLIDSSIFQTDI